MIQKVQVSVPEIFAQFLLQHFQHSPPAILGASAAAAMLCGQAQAKLKLDPGEAWSSAAVDATLAQILEKKCSRGWRLNIYEPSFSAWNYRFKKFIKPFINSQKGRLTVKEPDNAFLIEKHRISACLEVSCHFLCPNVSWTQIHPSLVNEWQNIKGMISEFKKNTDHIPLWMMDLCYSFLKTGKKTDTNHVMLFPPFLILWESFPSTVFQIN